MIKHFVADDKTRLQRLRHPCALPGAVPQAGIDGAPLALREAGAAVLPLAGVEQTPMASIGILDARDESVSSAKGASSTIAWGNAAVAFNPANDKAEIARTPLASIAFLDPRVGSVRSGNGGLSLIAWGNARGALNAANNKAPKARFPYRVVASAVASGLIRVSASGNGALVTAHATKR